jgi:hypothetical protein
VQEASLKHPQVSGKQLKTRWRGSFSRGLQERWIPRFHKKRGGVREVREGGEGD